MVFYDGTERPVKVSITGGWSEGLPHGQSEIIIKGKEYSETRNVELSNGNIHGNGGITIEFAGELAREMGVNKITYNGVFNNNEFVNGRCEIDYTDGSAAFTGVCRCIFDGEFSDGFFSGSGTYTVYYTDKVTEQTGFSYSVHTGTFNNNFPNGSGQEMLYYTDEYAAKIGADYLLNEGVWSQGKITEPYRYTYYWDDTAIESGTVKNGEKIPDGSEGSMVTDIFFAIGKKLAGWLAEEGGSKLGGAIGGFVGGKTGAAIGGWIGGNIAGDAAENVYDYLLS